ncbi:phytanoyl-CoA dioxygenase family protein [Romeria aff. gracilis LEGE 07310]|uniref:Phytanoyl-CoA dioxygenase family protein n=1 Tax=Vasconcelosia minhoensis LEGE 07310 TaxID=915328 RepID=A0A8J7ANT5_9CYAN|nr:phytanoyl-CoA dioxygenase family protein [Romeria gracilis]MBE9077551.1 phytanoyl-CoA dioxygenase family protein [Romeria aff. gracilis LEGE 07310]
MTYEPIQLTAAQLQQFEDDGFLIIENLLPTELAHTLASRLNPLFHGEFETGIYPDEWYWRPGLSLPDVTREMCNAWKCDRTIASLVLSAEIGRLSATLAGWDGARIGQDSLWMKPPGAKAIAMHQDGAYIDYLDPPSMMTCWIALDDASVADGTLIYARGSHKWDLVDVSGEFHAPTKDYRWAMLQAAEKAGVTEPELVVVDVPAGGCAFHHGRTWHGLCKTTRTEGVFHSIGLHTLPAQARFHPTNAPGYIYGRYKRIDDLELDESFFPILWQKDGYRTPFLRDYCEDALLSRTVNRLTTASV